MIEEARGNIDYDESGTGPTVVLVPGSCSTGSAWRPVIAGWNGAFHCVTTSLLGYGATAERRTDCDPSIAHEADIVEAVVRRAGGKVHLVGHSFGALVSLAVALRRQVSLASLTVIEAPAAELLHDCGELEQYCAFRQMTESYFKSFTDGNPEAIAAMIDFYGGAGTFASWPQRVRDYAVATTQVNIRDWASAYGFPLSIASLATVDLPVCVVRGGASHPAVQRANALLGANISQARLATIEGAAHFMIATHAAAVAEVIAGHIRAVAGPQEGALPATGRAA